MQTGIFQAEICELKEFKNLFIELTEKNCNQRCKHCYIDFPINKNVNATIPTPNPIHAPLEYEKIVEKTIRNHSNKR